MRKNIYVSTEEMSLREFLCTTCLFFNRVSVDDFAAKNRILVGEDVCTDLSRVLQPGTQVTLLTPQSFEPWVDEQVGVLFEDDFLLVLNKPAPLPMHPAGRHYFNTLTSVLERHHGHTKALYPVQRLDRETSGVVVIAKTAETASQLAKQFRKNTVRKEYIAVLRGSLTPPLGVFDGALSKQRVGEIRDHMVIADDGLPSVTGYEALAATGDYSVVLARPETGRRHQIRAHFAHAGFPLVGDKQYGGHPDLFVQFMKDADSVSEEELRENFGAVRHLLHAWKLHFRHPHSGLEMTFVAPLPSEITSFCEKKGLSLAKLD